MERGGSACGFRENQVRKEKKNSLLFLFSSLKKETQIMHSVMTAPMHILMGSTLGQEYPRKLLPS